MSKYIQDENILNLGSVKEIDMEALNSLEPELIIIGGRLLEEYDNLSKIGPTICLRTDNSTGYMNSVKSNIDNISKIFGVDENKDKIIKSFEERISKLNELAKNKTAILGLVTSSSLNTLGNNSRGSLITNEIGFENVASDIDSTHGDSASFELVLDKNPDYFFVLDRDTAINAEGAKIAKDVIENEIIMKSDAYKNGNIFYLTPDAWYLSEGGITATDIMLKDIESALNK